MAITSLPSNPSPQQIRFNRPTLSSPDHYEKNTHCYITLAKASVEFMVLSMNTRTGGNVDVAIKMVEPGVTSVTGRPQDIMMVIGQIASYGEDGLLSVAER